MMTLIVILVILVLLLGAAFFLLERHYKQTLLPLWVKRTYYFLRSFYSEPLEFIQMLPTSLTADDQKWLQKTQRSLESGGYFWVRDYSHPKFRELDPNGLFFTCQMRNKDGTIIANISVQRTGLLGTKFGRGLTKSRKIIALYSQLANDTFLSTSNAGALDWMIPPEGIDKQVYPNDMNPSPLVEIHIGRLSNYMKQSNDRPKAFTTIPAIEAMQQQAHELISEARKAVDFVTEDEMVKMLTIPQLPAGDIIRQELRRHRPLT